MKILDVDLGSPCIYIHTHECILTNTYICKSHTHSTPTLIDKFKMILLKKKGKFRTIY